MASDAILVEILKTVTRIEQKVDAMIAEDKSEDDKESKGSEEGGIEKLFGMDHLGGC